NLGSGAAVIIRTVVDDEAQREPALAGIRAITAGARVQGEAAVLLRDGRKIADIMHAESAGADLVIAGLRLPQGDDVDAFFERMNTILEGLPTTILVQSARSFESEPVLFPDEPRGPDEEPSS